MKRYLTKTSMPRLGHATQKVTRTVFKRYGPVLAHIFEDWSKIVGPRIALLSQVHDVTFPFKQKKEGTLHVRALPSSGPIIQHLEGAILERCNAYFGYKAVSRLRIEQSLSAIMPQAPKAPETEVFLKPEDDHFIEETLQDIDSEELRETLKKLGKEVFKVVS